MSGTPAEDGGRRRRLVVMIIALVLSVAILLAALVNGAYAQAEAKPQAETQEAPEPQMTKETFPDGPLVVPVFPRLREKKAPSDDSEPKLPAGDALNGSYIILEDGSMLTMGDWIKGSLTKGQTGAGMSDYQNRLFLGQVARAMAGMDENMVSRSVVSVGPPVPFKPNTISKPMQMIPGVFRMIVPGTDGYEWDPATSGGGFDRRVATAGGAAVQFEGQFGAALAQTAEEFQETGTMLNMLEAYKKKQAQDD